MNSRSAAFVILLLLYLVLSGEARGQEGQAKPTGQATPSFLVEPYLQLPTPSAMTIMWETSTKLPSRVEHGRTAALGNVTEEAKATILHEVRLEGLEAGATYYYRVRSGKLVSDIHTFNTAPAPGAQHWRMAVYGDSRSNPAMHRKVVEQVVKAKVDLIVHTGDIVLNGKKYDTWRQEFFEPIRPLSHSVPWVSTIGNHESDSENYFSYMALPGNERYFGFDYGNAHIICLDSNAWISKGRDSQQYQWLTAHLREPRAATWTFIAFHHPLFSASATRPINPVRWDWAPVFLDPANHVDAVLTGHDHFYARNYRMGRVADRPQPGVLFLTTAGGGASLYRSKARDYVAREKSAHHFTLFDFAGDRITVSAISITGAVLDAFVMTKEPTPPQEFCAYEVEEFRQFLRLALSSAPAVSPSGPSGGRVDTVLRVPTRFRIPVQGRLLWEPVAHWKMKGSGGDFHLQPGQALEIPLRAEIDPGAYTHTPALTIDFDPARFRNHTVTVYPFKLAGPSAIQVGETKKSPFVDGRLDDGCWDLTNGAADGQRSYALLGLPPRGGRSGRVQILADKDWLYVGARLEGPLGPTEGKAPKKTSGSRLVLFGEHLRVHLWDGKENHTFALSPEQVRYASIGQKEDREPDWRTGTAGQGGTWTAEVAIPRTLVPNLENARINIVHHHRDGKDFVDYELCPTYGLGTDPDVLPDWKPREAVERFARLSLR